MIPTLKVGGLVRREEFFINKITHKKMIFRKRLLFT